MRSPACVSAVMHMNGVTERKERERGQLGYAPLGAEDSQGKM